MNGTPNPFPLRPWSRRGTTDMHVAHILRKYVPAEWGGTETALQRLATGLAEHDVSSTVYFPGPSAMGGDPLSAAGCAMHPFHACVPIWGLSPGERQRMLAVGGNLMSFDLPGMLARDRTVDVIHSHALGRIGGIARTIARRRHVPFVVTVHGGVLDLPPALKENLNAPRPGGVEWGRLFGWWWRARHLLADADAILTCNQREAELLREQYPQQRIVVQPHGVCTTFFRTDQRAAARAAFPAIAGRTLLLCVGRLDPVKNQLWLVQQLQQIVARNPDVLLVLVGACTNADYGVELHRQIRELGLTNHVLLTGGLPPGTPAVAGLMQEARVSLLPSVAETFGIVVLEAWAAGLPVFASRTTGALALIRDGENGHLFDLADPTEFHAKLRRLLEVPAHHAHLAFAGRRGADEYDTTVLAGHVRDLYAQLCEEKHALRDSA